MARISDGIFLDGDQFAKNGDKAAPPFTLEDGYGIVYSQPGGLAPTRPEFNQYFNDISAALIDLNAMGILLWDTTISYVAGAVVVGSDGKLYSAISLNDGNDPISSSTEWQPLYEGLAYGAAASGDATPSVAGLRAITTANAGPTTITGFDDGLEGQLLVLVAGDSNTTIAAGLTALGMSATLAVGDTLSWIYKNSSWRQIAGSVGMGMLTYGTAADGDATPSVAGLKALKTANTGATTITDFDNGVDGQVITVSVNDANTTIDGGLTHTGRTIPCIDGDVMSFAYDGAAWAQVGGNIGMGIAVLLAEYDPIGDWPASSTIAPQDVDVSDDGARKGANGVIVSMHLYLNGNLVLNARRKGSSDTSDNTIIGRTSNGGTRTLRTLVIPLDDDGKFQAWFSTTGTATLNIASVVGYTI